MNGLLVLFYLIQNNFFKDLTLDDSHILSANSNVNLNILPYNALQDDSATCTNSNSTLVNGGSAINALIAVSHEKSFQSGSSSGFIDQTSAEDYSTDAIDLVQVPTDDYVIIKKIDLTGNFISM